MEPRDQEKRPYSPPSLTTLTLEQAKEFVADRRNAAKKKPMNS
jgi:hypothetical protein